MQLITIQSVKILDVLSRNQDYIVYDKVHRIETYKHLQKLLKLPQLPIFCGVLGKPINLYGVNTDNACVLMLDVPEHEIKLTEYYTWTDFMYYSGEGENNPKIAKSLGKELAEQLSLDKYHIPQAILSHIKPSWIIAKHKCTQHFVSKCDGIQTISQDDLKNK
jgi:hypothetical protein